VRSRGLARCPLPARCAPADAFAPVQYHTQWTADPRRPRRGGCAPGRRGMRGVPGRVPMRRLAARRRRRRQHLRTRPAPPPAPQKKKKDGDGKGRVESLFERAKELGAEQGTDADLPSTSGFGGAGRTVAGGAEQVRPLGASRWGQQPGPWAGALGRPTRAAPTPNPRPHPRPAPCPAKPGPARPRSPRRTWSSSTPTGCSPSTTAPRAPLTTPPTRSSWTQWRGGSLAAGREGGHMRAGRPGPGGRSGPIGGAAAPREAPLRAARRRRPALPPPAASARRSWTPGPARSP
jgi:hypothetical protein